MAENIPLNNKTPNTPEGATFLSIPQALQLALRQQQAGQLAQAQSLLRKVLQTEPGNGDALHALGIIAHQSGNIEQAQKLLTQAMLQQSENAVLHANLGEILRQSGQLEQAIVHCQRALELNPRSAAAHSNLGIIYYDQTHYAQARQCQHAALELQPGMLQALNNLGSIERDQANNCEAIDYFQQVLALDPNHLESLNNLGAVLTESRQPEQGLEYLQRALKLQPDYAEALRNIGSCWLVLENYGNALRDFNHCLQLRPDFSEALQGLASVHQHRQNYALAEQYIEQALALSPDDPDIYSQRGQLFSDMGFADKSWADYQQALRRDPQHIAAHLGMSLWLTEQGQIEEAAQCLYQVLRIDNESLAARIALAHLIKANSEDDTFTALVAELNKPQLSPVSALSLHFALGKCYDDIRDYDRAFPHFLEGCRLKRKTVKYDKRDTAQKVLEIAAAFSPERIKQLQGSGDPSTLPIFVLGMPRSGTTLTEQIIASHSQCFGAGELPDLMMLADRPRADSVYNPSNQYPQLMGALSPELLSEMGSRYVNGLRKRQAGVQHITDKMPANFLALGLIHLMLPNAKIVHVKRNPVDTCLSGLSKLFRYGQHHSYDLAEQGYFYRHYATLMQHWRTVLPEGVFYEIHYEDLVTDTENQSRALIEYCGLPWDEKCLSFHNTSRTVRTASATQVRRPIYKTSVERWRRYDSFLSPLLDALGEFAPDT